MPIIQLNNRKVHILEMNTESPQTIVMIHGMFTNMSVFYFNIAPKLAEHFHIVLYDLKGHGMSERSDKGYDLKAMSDDLIELLNKLNLSQVHLVGYSYGGLIAMETAMNHPDRVNKLTVIESPKPDQGEAPEILQKFGNEFIDQYLSNYKDTIHLQPSKRQIQKNRELFDYLFNHTTIKEDFEKDNEFFNDISDNPIKNQTLLLYGQSSDCVEAGAFLSRALPNSLFFKGRGDHNLPVQNPRWIVNKLIDFLK